MDTLKQIVMQEANEERFSRKFIDIKIREEISSNPDIQDKIDLGVELLEKYLEGSYYPSKMLRLEQVRMLELRRLVEDIFVGIAYFRRPELYSSVCAQMVSRLKFSEKVAGITTIAEIIAVLHDTYAFDITRNGNRASLMLQSQIALTKQTNEFIEHSAYLPPMVCTPLPLKNNYSSGYLTHNDSLILGQGNHHSGDICLDVLNTMNAVPLRLDTDFLSTVEEEPTFVIEDPDQQRLWDEFKKQSYYFYSLMVNQGNRFHLTHKVDKRGRIYAQGYHINTQGTSFKKAMIELANEEVVTGI